MNIKKYGQIVNKNSFKNHKVLQFKCLIQTHSLINIHKLE